MGIFQVIDMGQRKGLSESLASALILNEALVLERELKGQYNYKIVHRLMVEKPEFKELVARYAESLIVHKSVDKVS